MLPEMARVLDAIVSHRAGRLSCVEAGELPGLSERHFRRLRDAYEDRGEEGLVDVGEDDEFVSGSRRGSGRVGGGVSGRGISVLESNTSTSRSWDRRCCAGLFTRRLPRACRVGHNLASMKKWKKAADPGSGREAGPGRELLTASKIQVAAPD
jgi:hypothetical protein